MQFIDSHAHLDFDQYDQDRDELLKRAGDASVEYMIQIAMGPDRAKVEKCHQIALSKPNIFMAVGIHPHDADQFSDDALKLVDEFSGAEKVLAIGEIGLDYYYENSSKENQKQCFSRIMDLAINRKMPVCIHTRDAFDDTLSLTQEKNIFEKVGGVIHCFTGTAKQAEQFINIGAYISFSGVVTFKKAEEIKEAARTVPLENMLIETDSPFLAPTPYRGKRNEPSYVVEVAKTIAAIKGCSVEEVASATTANAKKLFRIPSH